MSRPSGLRAPTSATTALAAALIIVSVLSKVAGRKLGPGGEWLVFNADLVRAGELWRLVTYPFVEGEPFALLMSTLVFYLLGSQYEARVGAATMGRFFAAASVGGALLAMVFHQVLNLAGVFVDSGSAEGPRVVVDALLVVFALEAPDAKVLFGFILPMPARTVVKVILGIELLFALMQGQAALSITLGGMAMGWLLYTGRWHPRTWRRRQTTLRKRRSDIYIVRPRDPELH